MDNILFGYRTRQSTTSLGLDFIKTPKQINPSVYRIISIKDNAERTNVCEIYCTSNINSVY
nr:MAG TPA: hypothetical protein [Caudoviricetes sp.]